MCVCVGGGGWSGEKNCVVSFNPQCTRFHYKQEDKQVKLDPKMPRSKAAANALVSMSQPTAHSDVLLPGKPNIFGVFLW